MIYRTVLAVTNQARDEKKDESCWINSPWRGVRSCCGSLEQRTVSIFINKTYGPV